MATPAASQDTAQNAPQEGLPHVLRRMAVARPSSEAGDRGHGGGKRVCRGSRGAESGGSL